MIGSRIYANGQTFLQCALHDHCNYGFLLLFDVRGLSLSDPESNLSAICALFFNLWNRVFILVTCRLPCGVFFEVEPFFAAPTNVNSFYTNGWNLSFTTFSFTSRHGFYGSCGGWMLGCVCSHCSSDLHIACVLRRLGCIFMNWEWESLLGSSSE